jgi:hypothetical protein
MRKVFQIVAGIMMCAGALVANPARAENEVALFSGTSVVADFVAEDPVNECVIANAVVWFSTNLERPGNNNPVAGGTILIRILDKCQNFQETFRGLGIISPQNGAEFTVKGQVRQATLKADNVIVCGSSCIPFLINLAWSRTGRPITTKTFSSDALFIVATESEKSFQAVASGEITHGSANYAQNTATSAIITANTATFVIRLDF